MHTTRRWKEHQTRIEPLTESLMSWNGRSRCVKKATYLQGARLLRRRNIVGFTQSIGSSQ
jgi:hypothetical protein